MAEQVCRDIFSQGATWRREWAGYTPAEREEFVSITAGFGIVVSGGFDPASPFPPDLVAAPGTACYGWQDPGASVAQDGAPALVPGGVGPEAWLAGIPSLPRSLLDWLLSLPRALLDALRRLWDMLRNLLPSGVGLLLLLLALAALVALYVSRD